MLSLSFLMYLCLFSSAVGGSQPTVRMFAAGSGEQDLVATSGDTIVTMDPGGEKSINVWVQDTLGEHEINGWTFVLPAVAVSVGNSTGTVTYVDNDNPGFADSIFLNKFEPLYVFTDVSFTKDLSPQYMETGTSFGMSYSTLTGIGVNLTDATEVPNPLGPHYIGEFVLIASGDARGEFVLEFETSASELRSVSGDPYDVGEFQRLVVSIAECSDGFVDLPEQCDDGNSVSGDGCSASCSVELGFACAGEPSVCSSSEAVPAVSPIGMAALLVLLAGAITCKWNGKVDRAV